MDAKILERYGSEEGAASYRKKFEKHWNERLNNRFEQRLVRQFLGEVALESPRSAVALDLPCGYGRLYPLVRELGVSVVEADWSEPMLAAARELQKHDPAAEYTQADALHLPFSDGQFDLVVSVRLCHHIRSHQERLQYVREILRVSRNWALFTFFDEHSVKNRMRELKRRFSPKKRPKWTLRQSEVRELLRDAGFAVVRSRPLSRLFSGHRYVLARRESSPERADPPASTSHAARD